MDCEPGFIRGFWWSGLEVIVGILKLHGASPPLIWLLQMTYANQKSQGVTDNDKGHEFDICAGLRQGCLLSPRLFCSVLQLAMGRWRSRVEYFGLHLGDGMSHFIGSAFC